MSNKYKAVLQDEWKMRKHMELKVDIRTYLIDYLTDFLRVPEDVAEREVQRFLKEKSK